FSGTLEIFSKSNLFRTLDMMKSWFPEDYDFYPRTWFLPQQQYQFNASFKYMTDKKAKHKPTFIVKPSEGSQGEGIYLLRDPSQYTQQGVRKHVIQEYLTDVLLINDYKFDLRVYVVIKSINPLVIYICKEGLARFSTIPYEQPNAKNIHESFMHLTNYSLNKKSSTFDKSQKENEGSKRKLTQVFKVLEKKGYNCEKLWSEIELIVCKTILAVIGDLQVEYNSHIPNSKSGPSCFQIFGFDILILKDLKPMLLEVNSNPSLRIDCEQEVSPGIMGYVLSLKDEEVKRPLIQDTLMLVAPPQKYTHSEEADVTNENEESEEANDNEESNITNGDSNEQGNNEEYEESCLKEIFPSIYGAECQHLHIMEILSNMFMSCLSVRGSSRLTSSAFRLFTRKSKIISKGITNATVDIIYIDVQRKWEHFNHDKTTGNCLNFNGFVDACHELAKKKFPSNDKLEMMQNFIDYCKENIEAFNKRQ
ncbi:hypothetical protein LOTGIDRAFT_53477, partial [Lottia gigantea]